MKIFTPYRVCPLGAHVDHQHGVVTGFAIDKGVSLEFEPTEDGSIYMTSKNYAGVIEFHVDEEPERALMAAVWPSSTQASGSRLRD